jgi:16S rRNA (uracil1498-N3)-methyltransferase
MQYFYIPDITSKIILLPPAESAHCIKVLRLTKGDTVNLTDGKGGLFKTVIQEDNSKKCKVEIVESQKESGRAGYRIHLAVAPTKNISRFEWFLEKATEIGIDEITPILCEHSERKIIKPERLNKVIIAAMKQSLKTFLPVLNPMTNYRAFINNSHNGDKFIAYCSDQFEAHLKEKYNKTQNVVVMIGPEGDFSPDEVKQAIENRFTPVSLGENRLRTETAAIVACHTINLVNE